MNSFPSDISSALEGMRRRAISAAELGRACFRQIARLDPLLNTFITVTPDIPISAPQSTDLPLYGIPIAIKDLYETAGVLTTCGTPFFKDYVPAKDALAVEKLKRAGALLVGKTNTHEIALGVTGVNPHYGTAKNPWDLLRISGGSSSGSAAAVAAGMCLAALGTDTGGSIRIPASLCGVVGLKPTFGRISLRGVFPLSWNLDHVGPLTRSVKDAAILLQVLAGYDPLDPVFADVPVDDYLARLDEGVAGWKVALADGEYVAESDPEVLAAFSAAARTFELLGAKVEKVEVGFLREAARANTVMIQADAAAIHRERILQQPEIFGEDVRQRLQTGAALPATDYALARRTQTETRRRFEQLFADYDILLTPSTPIAAPLIEGNDAIEQARRLTHFTSSFNLAGLPALSLPCGFTADGLPVGLQIVSQAWAEAKVLRASQAFEQATKWHKKSAGI
jgi:aspartyl-tRNA(Asn)/glutamyl-tRNA(Gln) amidotransferase subunit A